MEQQHSINDVVWLTTFEGYAVVVGVTDKLHLVVKWYNDEGENFIAVVAQEDCVQPTNQNQ
tara:strand:+ start:243 stop:425 length:183 start_codon:yes stop_codon:yes gene_type:complete